MWRLAGARGGDRGVHHVGVSALVDGLDLDVVLGGVEARCDGIEGVAKRAGHGVPPDDLGLGGLCTRAGIRGAAASAALPASRVRRFMFQGVSQLDRQFELAALAASWLQDYDIPVGVP